ncbi:hypothetical protein JCM8547_001513 [Rhodosporidiobolus lusitaniae]
MLPASPFEPTPRSPATTASPAAVTMDDRSSALENGGTAAAGEGGARAKAEDVQADPFPLTAPDHLIATTHAPMRDSPAPKPDEPDSASLPFHASTSSAAPPATAAEEDRKPSLPPPQPFASTSALASDIDDKRSPLPDHLNFEGTEEERRSRSVTASGSGSNTPRGVKSEEEDSDEKPVLKNLKKGKGKGRQPKVESEPQLIGDLPSGEEEAAATYTELDECTYASKKLGDTPYFDEDAARCDCQYDPDEPEDEQACGDHSNCMNRLMQIECMKGDCRCGRHCQNQRFQKKQYAKIDIVKTEKKGFGVRALEDMAADTFVYEYIGEVIGPTPFARKMKEYANEGIKHFYFMALDREVFIDATKKGGKGRFLNHSCNPNCVVAKWTVGKKMRMGIFTKRAIQKDEELTFNYNVDRYGHVAQECFCGEPNCVGFIGGKTQTDIGGMDDLYIDALGITEEVEALGLKGSKRKKGKKLDEDFTPTLYPIQLDEVPKVSAAMRQAIQTRRILEKLLARVHMTTDEEVQRNLLRLHGLNLMRNILLEYPSDTHILTLDLEILSSWRLQTRNKIESSNIEEAVTRCLSVEDEKVKELASGILSSWGELKLAYRIPKADSKDDADRKRPSDFHYDQLSKRARLDDVPTLEESSRPEWIRPTANKLEERPRPSRKLPEGWEVRYDMQSSRDYYVHLPSGRTQREFPTHADSPLPPARPVQPVLSAADLIAQAEAEAQAVKDAEAKKLAEEKAEREREKRERHEARKAEKDEKERGKKEKKVMGLFSGVVVATMSKYKSQFEPEAFKKRAKEVSQILVDKEKKRPSYATDSYDSLSTEKEAKVKSFVKDWTKKLLERKKLGGGGSSSRGSSTPSGKRPDSAATGSLADRPSPATPAVGTPMDVDTPRNGSNGHGKDDESPGTPPRASGLAGAA